MSDNRGRNTKSRGRPKAPPNSQLFDDTSIGQGSYGYPQGYDYNNQPNNFYGQNYAQDNPQYANVPSYPGQQLFNDPMTNMAMQYGQALAGQGSELINKNIEEYVSKSNIKYYFAVDTTYVAKKLGLLVFPFAHKDWTLSHNQDGPVAPRFDVNARDLYIPVMAFVTYTLLAGVLLGMQHKFSPEQLGVISSTALVWTVLEMLLLLITKSILNIPSGNNSPSYLDWLACCGYKYVGIIIVLLASIPFFSTGYYASLAWMSFSIAFFLVKSLRVSILGHPDAGTFELASKRRLYMLLLVAIIQPVLMWWLTRKLAILEPLEESFD